MTVPKNTNTEVTVQTQPLPVTGYVRLPQIIGNPKAKPPIPAIIPVSKSTWWNGIKEGRFPKPVKLGPRTTAWHIEDIRQLIESACELPFTSRERATS